MRNRVALFYDNNYELKIEEIADNNKLKCFSCPRKIMNQTIAVSHLQLEDATCIYTTCIYKTCIYTSYI